MNPSLFLIRKKLSNVNENNRISHSEKNYGTKVQIITRNA